MGTSGLLPRVVDAVERVTARAADADELLEGVATEIGKAIPYDGGMWFGLDPTTLLAVAPSRMEHLDDGYCNTFWFGEFHEQDADLIADLARDPSPAAILRSATDERPMRSARYRDFLKPQGYEDELRVVFRAGGRSWGAGGLFREPGRDPFDEHDVALLQAVSPIVAAGFRTHAALAAADPRVHPRPGPDAVLPRRRHPLGQRRRLPMAGRHLRVPTRARTGSTSSPASTAPTSRPPSP